MSTVNVKYGGDPVSIDASVGPITIELTSDYTITISTAGISLPGPQGPEGPPGPEGPGGDHSLLQNLDADDHLHYALVVVAAERPGSPRVGTIFVPQP